MALFQQGSVKQSPVRPITARALQVVIDTLRPQLHGSAVLDLFAGHGRLGAAALREGARAASFVDIQIAPELQALKKKYGPAVHLVHQNALVFLRNSREWFDLIFADPPFSKTHTLVSDLATLAAPRLALGGILVVKAPKRMVASGTWDNAQFALWKHKEIGESQFIFLRRKSNGNLP